MNAHFLLGIGWPEQATFNVPYGLASVLALFLTIGLLAFLKRIADEHYRLLKEKEQEDEAAAAADEEDKEEERKPAAAQGPGGKLLVLMGLVLSLGATLVHAEDVNTYTVLAVGWPGSANLEIPSPLASAVALIVAIWFIGALRRTANEHSRLRKEEEESERKRKAAKATSPHLIIVLAGLLSVVPAFTWAADSKEPAPAAQAAASPEASPTPPAKKADAGDSKEPAPAISVGAFVETYLAWNFNEPDNGITAFRGFDAHHNSFALSNAVLDTRWNAGAVSGRLALQTGDTPDIYYGAEATSDVRHILEATIAWKAPVGKGLTLDGGICLSPIGPEVIPVKDNWTWSRSTLFYGLPFYHTGVRATYPVTERWNVTAHVYNGWNSLADTNGKKSLSLQGVYTRPDKVTASLLYFGGAERPRGAPEGEPWRHLFDSYVTLTVSPTVSIQAQLDGGFERTTFGRASWRAGAVAARVKAKEWLYIAGRADILDETVPTSGAGSASALFFPAKRVQSLTATLDARPADRMSVRLEFRRDSASDPIYFKGSNAAASAKSQTTVTFGMTAWF